MGATHSFPLEEVFNYLKPATVRDKLVQAVLDAPMFGIRFRWNASRSLAILRNHAGKRVPATLQRMYAEDLVSLVFPDQLACLENIQGDREIPDHPLVQQTIHDCLTEAMDIEKLEALLGKIQRKELKLISRDLREPSPLAQEILNANSYAFLDPAPLEERRTRAIQNRRWLDPAVMSKLGQLDQNAIVLVKEEAWPEAESADDLHDALVLLGCITDAEGKRGSGNTSWETFLTELIAQGRATKAVLENKDEPLWVAAERLPQFAKIFPEAVLDPVLKLPKELKTEVWEREKAALELVRSRLEGVGPTTQSELAQTIGLSEFEVELALLGLENEGFVFRGQFTEGIDDLEWCERRLLARINRYTIERLRKEIEPVGVTDYMRFLFAKQHIDSDTRPGCPAGNRSATGRIRGTSRCLGRLNPRSSNARV